ncbi:MULTISPECIES: prolyl oligopeptidase family serine peptidase [Acidobacteriaceae]|uniref:glucuronyl esterase domain-containing protein n=1 Tax=Acidobacteriaceae TaxID=204434 RepID=UPI00131A98AA|nr:MULTISPECIES: prolyl oligopeptidase family serine peptidase [Acidobacteriaceae]MDW5265468.1 prolyl oligopeptidase family serine peptidase [Edaphobacter sp.]
MTLKSVSSLCVLAFTAFTMKGQAPPPTPKPAPSVVAGIPVNYDQSKVGTYTLPDALKLDDGKEVRDAKAWNKKRRPEIVRLFETQQYGIAPGRPAGESFEVVDKGTPALNGTAIRREIDIHLSKDSSWPVIHLLEYVPANAKKPVPMFFSINFGAIQNAVEDPGITPQKVWSPKTNTLIAPPAGPGFGRLNVQPILDAGIGVATFYYGDIDPDYAEGFSNGIRARYLKPGETKRATDDWGSIAAWAWGMSRVEDYFETDKSVDAKRVVIHGVSRLGKTVMWAGAHDQRFAAVIASCSGEGGAALSHRDYGETIAHLTAPTRYPYQFAENFAKYAGFPDTAPMDANMLVALIAPRPLLLQTGSTDDWSDPKGEFLAAVAAGPVYKLLGKQDLGTDVWPAAKTPLFSNGLNYYMHEGGHGMVPSDWDIYVQFLKAQLHPEQ